MPYEFQNAKHGRALPIYRGTITKGVYAPVTDRERTITINLVICSRVVIAVGRSGRTVGFIKSDLMMNGKLCSAAEIHRNDLETML